jgi:predicted GNAT family acetyltransferase
MSAPASIRHDSDARRFETTVDGNACILEYRLADGIMTITHTEVPPAVAGRGIAGILTRAAFDRARHEGWRVVPACAYAAAWVRRHREVADLLV